MRTPGHLAELLAKACLAGVLVVGAASEAAFNELGLWAAKAAAGSTPLEVSYHRHGHDGPLHWHPVVTPRDAGSRQARIPESPSISGAGTHHEHPVAIATTIVSLKVTAVDGVIEHPAAGRVKLLESVVRADRYPREASPRGPPRRSSWPRFLPV